MSDQNTIKNRIEKNFKHKAKWARKNNIDAYRIYERDIPEFPYIVDVYQNYLVIFERTDDEIDQGKEHHLDFLINSLIEVTKIDKENIILKSRFKQSGNLQYEKLDSKKEYINIKEINAHFLVNLHDYLDTGLFLDHRPMRQTILKEAKDKKFLNLFCYTGSVSVMAALGGAKSVTSVDLSHTYLNWAKDNFKANDLDLRSHLFIEENALKYLEKCHVKFDLIFLDPPTFSNSKKMDDDFEVEKDQLFLVQNCLRILNPNGVLYFSCNKRKFKLDPEIEKFAIVKNITSITIPQDFRDEKIHHCFKITHKV